MNLILMQQAIEKPFMRPKVEKCLTHAIFISKDSQELKCFIYNNLSLSIQYFFTLPKKVEIF